MRNIQKHFAVKFLFVNFLSGRVPMYVFWFLFSLLFLLLELGHPGLLFFVSFAVGAIGAGIVSFLTPDIALQVGVFLGVTIIALAALKRWVITRGIRHPHHGASNIYALEGKKGLVIKEIRPNIPGQVKLNGEIWSARALHEEVIEIATEVIVLYVKGAHVVVERIKL